MYGVNQHASGVRRGFDRAIGQEPVAETRQKYTYVWTRMEIRSIFKVTGGNVRRQSSCKRLDRSHSRSPVFYRWTKGMTRKKSEIKR